MTSRRRFLLQGLAGALPVLLHAGPAAGQQQPLAGQGTAGELRDPAAAGRPRDRATERDNDEYIKQVEHRLQCTCGCTLDIYTCRTTDFTCEFSPRLHREVLALGEQGKTDQEIIDAFVAKYGEKVLMAPKAQGFNLAGYVVPGIVIALIGALLTWVILRRVRRSAPVPAVASAGPSAPVTPVEGMSHADAERLRRALEEIET